MFSQHSFIKVTLVDVVLTLPFFFLTITMLFCHSSSWLPPCCFAILLPDYHHVVLPFFFLTMLFCRSSFTMLFCHSSWLPPCCFASLLPDYHHDHHAIYPPSLFGDLSDNATLFQMGKFIFHFLPEGRWNRAWWVHIRRQYHQSLCHIHQAYILQSYQAPLNLFTIVLHDMFVSVAFTLITKPSRAISALSNSSRPFLPFSCESTISFHDITMNTINVNIAFLNVAF